MQLTFFNRTVSISYPLIILYLLVVCGISILISDISSATTYTVTNTNNTGSGSLRQAITDANSASDIDVIEFSIGSGTATIQPLSPLPVIINPVTIDGTSQPGYSGSPIIEISGSSAGSSLGIRVTGNGSGSSLIGLVINRFSAQGIFIDTGNVTVKNCYVGTDLTGQLDYGNGGDGIAIFSGVSIATSNNNTIGGVNAGEGNLISGNGGNGIGVTSQDGGTVNGTAIYGNLIGTNITGTSAIQNVGDGILLNNSLVGSSASLQDSIIGSTTNTTPGGACTGGCNLVSGNRANGIGLWHIGVTGTTVVSNYVGTNKSGTGALANGDIGIEINETPQNTIGDRTAAGRNIFSGNLGAGIFITGWNSIDNVIQGNYIGTNVSGTGAIANMKMGIGIGSSPGAVGAHNNLIGGTLGVSDGGDCIGACNLISGNIDNGIFISGSESFGQQIVGNYIGTNYTGNSILANGKDGIGIINTPNTQIGGSTTTHRNVIAGNGSNGIVIAGNASTGNRIEFNRIGIAANGSSLGNAGSGVALSSATWNIISSNSIAFNSLLGIDLDNNGSPNLNDTNDADNGANHLQNYPYIYAASTKSGVTRIGGQFHGTPSSSYRLEFFESTGCNAGKPMNYGEGQTYIGYKDISTDQFGNTAFSFLPASPVAGNKYVTSTATKKLNGVPAETSEFSKCALVNASKPSLTNGAAWHLKDDLTMGVSDYDFGYGFPSSFLMCAWDPNQPGVKLPTIYSNGAWYMRASYTTGIADLSFSYGNSSQRPVCGDWDGDGVDTIGTVSGDSIWRLRNTNSGGSPDAAVFQYGAYGSTPVVGDWDGDGVDTIGTVTKADGLQWNLRNSLSGGAPTYSFSFGSVYAQPVVGDWDGDGDDDIGNYLNGQWDVRASLSNGAPTGSFSFGTPDFKAMTW